MRQKEKEIIEKIGELLMDKTVYKVDLENEDERFGSMVTLTYLQRKIYPLLDILLKDRFLLVK